MKLGGYSSRARRIPFDPHRSLCPRNPGKHTDTCQYKSKAFFLMIALSYTLRFTHTIDFFRPPSPD